MHSGDHARVSGKEMHPKGGARGREGGSRPYRLRGGAIGRKGKGSVSREELLHRKKWTTSENKSIKKKRDHKGRG